MLELRPSCEHCNKSLPPESAEAMICTFECTFCSDCVKDILENVCPNCGGGFSSRPIRPINNLKDGNCLQKYPASSEAVVKLVDVEAHVKFAARIKNIPPNER